MIVRSTQSLCPICLRRLDASYIQEGDSTFFSKLCPEHGSYRVPVWRTAKTMPLPRFTDWSRPKTPSYPSKPLTPIQHGCPYDCGLCPDHGQHTCTGLIEVTKRCNMACPVCYADAGGGNLSVDPGLQEIAARLDALKEAAGACNLQLSGGEPTVRDDLPAIIDLARQRGFGLVQCNTNGLRLAQDAHYAASLANAGLDSVYLQWDGVKDESSLVLRGRFCLANKRRAVENCAKAGLGVVLVATIVSGINDAELGDLLRLALSLGPFVRGLHLQPVAFFGRYPWPLQQAPRLTLPELMAALTKQAPELVKPSDFHPPACEHELCSFSAVYERIDRAGKPGLVPRAMPQPCCEPALVPPLAKAGAKAARQFTALHWKGLKETRTQVKALPNEGDGFDRFLARSGAAKRFTLSCMAFQDALSLDLARVRGCCIHVVRHDGRLIPFCLHNLTAEDGTRLYSTR